MPACKEYHRKYYERNKARLLEAQKKRRLEKRGEVLSYLREYREAHFEAESNKQRNYRAKNCRRKSFYVGVTDSCPKCGVKGYRFYKLTLNRQTNAENLYAVVHHYAFNEKGVWAYDHMCYIGKGELWRSN